MKLNTICLLLVSLQYDVGSMVVVSYKEMVSGETVHLECDIEADENDGWSHIPVGSDEIVDVMAGRTPNVNYGDRFSIDSRKNYDLVIVDVQMKDAGTYICRRPPYEQVIRYNLTVLDTSPVCSSEDANQLVAENSCGTKPSSISLYCRVKYSGVVAPVLEWIGIDGKNLSRNRGEGTNVVVSTIHPTVKWDAFTFTCQTKESKKSCHSVIKKPLYAFNTTEKRTISSPQTVTCLANSSQQCSYKWIYEGEEVQSLDNTLELVPDSIAGEYQCLAECQFHGRLCVIQALLLTYIPSSNNWNANHLLIYTHTATAIAALLFGLILTKCSRIILKRITKVYCYLRNKVFGSANKERNNNDEEGEKLTNESSPVIGSKDFDPEEKRTKNMDTLGRVKGIAVLGDRFFISKVGEKFIEGFNTKTLARVIEIPVKSLKELRDMVACHRRKVLYLSDRLKCAVIRVSVDYMETLTWSTGTIPEGLSVTDESTVLVSCPSEHAIKEFTHDGKQVRIIERPTEHSLRMYHVWKMSNGAFLVCYGPEDDVDPIEPNRAFVFTSAEQTNILKYPRGNTDKTLWFLRVAETKQGFIIVISYNRKQLLLLDSKLQLIRVLIEIKGDFAPNRMCLDEKNKRLYVSEHSEDSTMSRISIHDLDEDIINGV